MNPATYRKLVAAGLTPDQVGVVMDIIEETERPYLEADAARKANVRERVSKWRAKQPVTLPKHNGNATETAHASVPPAPDLENKQTNKQENKKERASRLPKDWVLPCAWFDEAEAAGLPASRVDAEARKMHNWSLSDRNGAKLDWHATWRNWFQRALESLTKATGPPKPPTLATMWRDEARNLGILNDPASQPNRRVEARFASGDDSMPGIARRIAGAGG